MTHTPCSIRPARTTREAPRAARESRARAPRRSARPPTRRGSGGEDRRSGGAKPREGPAATLRCTSACHACETSFISMMTLTPSVCHLSPGPEAPAQPPTREGAQNDARSALGRVIRSAHMQLHTASATSFLCVQERRSETRATTTTRRASPPSLSEACSTPGCT